MIIVNKVQTDGSDHFSLPVSNKLIKDGIDSFFGFLYDLT